MILTFCGTQNIKQNEEDTGIANVDGFSDHDYSELKRFSRNDELETIFQNENQNRIFDFDDLGGRLGRGRYQKRSLKRGKRNFHSENDVSDMKPKRESFHNEIEKFLKENQKPKKSEKHLWTAILVKNNNVSALKFVEFASVLMKYGYDVTKGELISFGKCEAVRK